MKEYKRINSFRKREISGVFRTFIILLMVVFVSCTSHHTGSSENLEEKSIQDPIASKNPGEIIKEVGFQRFLVQNGVSSNMQFSNDFEYLQPNNLYTNQYYNFTIDFPDAWQIDRGPHEFSVARAFERDSGLAITLAVIPIPGKKSDNENEDVNSLEHLNSITNGNPLRFYRENLKQQSGIDPIDLTIVNYKIGRYEFTGPSYKLLQHFPSGTKYFMRTTTLNSHLFDYTYTISYSAPELFYNNGLLESVLNSFQAIKPQSNIKDKSASVGSKPNYHQKFDVSGYDCIGGFRNNYCIVCIGGERPQQEDSYCMGGKCGVIDLENNIVLPIEFDYIYFDTLTAHANRVIVNKGGSSNFYEGDAAYSCCIGGMWSTINLERPNEIMWRKYEWEKKKTK